MPKPTGRARAKKPAKKIANAVRAKARAEEATHFLPKVIGVKVEDLTLGSNPRREYDFEGVVELARSIREIGMEIPLLVERGPNGTFIVIEGQRRLAALRHGIAQKWFAADRTWIAMVRSPAESAEDMLLAQLARNTSEEISPLDQARAFARLRAASPKRFSTKYIAAAVGRSQRFVQRRLDLIASLAAPVLDALERGDITLAMAEALMPAKADEQERVLAMILANPGNPYTEREIADLVADGHVEKEAPPPATARETVERVERERGGRIQVRSTDGSGEEPPPAPPPDDAADAAPPDPRRTYLNRWSAIRMLCGHEPDLVIPDDADVPPPRILFRLPPSTRHEVPGTYEYVFDARRPLPGDREYLERWSPIAGWQPNDRLLADMDPDPAKPPPALVFDIYKANGGAPEGRYVYRLDTYEAAQPAAEQAAA